MERWKTTVENFVETVENLFLTVFEGQHRYYKGYTLKMQDFLPKKRRFFISDLWNNSSRFGAKSNEKFFCGKKKTGFPHGKSKWDSKCNRTKSNAVFLSCFPSNSIYFFRACLKNSDMTKSEEFFRRTSPNMIFCRM